MLADPPAPGRGPAIPAGQRRGLAATPLRPVAPGRGAEVAIVVDPRFPGGTAGAVAAEIAALAPYATIEVHALRTRLFSRRGVNPTLDAVLESHGLELIENAPVIRAETIVLHNPSCLKRDTAFGQRMSCARAFIVCHENFLRPGGSEGFDVGHCLGLIDRALACGARILAPISPTNRAGVRAWQDRERRMPGANWPVAPVDWFNVIDLPRLPPNRAPRDRRGRHSRPGFEKFPPLDRLRRQFPEHADSCVILGADNLISMPDVPAHWRLLPFGAVSPAEFLSGIDFFVYFTNPLWQESFGRVIAEAISAGKVVITDPATAEPFGPAVIRDPEEGRGDSIDRIIAEFVADSGRYATFVREAQTWLRRYRPEVFARQFLSLVDTAPMETFDAAL